MSSYLALIFAIFLLYLQKEKPKQMDINRKEFAKSIVGFLIFFAIMYAGVYGGATILKNIGTMKIKYPVTEREGVVDNYHGVEIADPYRWLEDDILHCKVVSMLCRS